MTVEHLGSFTLFSPFHLPFVSGPQTNVVSASAWKERPSRHVNVQTSLPPTMEQFLYPLNGFPSLGQARQSSRSFDPSFPRVNIPLGQEIHEDWASLFW